jgi:hypothetical protein
MATTTHKKKTSPSRVIARTTRGTAITERSADELAREAQAGYDLSKAQRVGRPSLGRGGQSPRLSFRTSRDLYERATRTAVKEGKTLSELARSALERYVA